MADLSWKAIETGASVSGSKVEVAGAGGPVPQTPWDLSLFHLLQQGEEEVGRAVAGPPACCLQGSRSALGSHPCVALSSAGAKGVFPVSVSLGVYRAGNGKRGFELVASGVTNDFTPGGQLSQGRADRGGANATKFLQLLNGDRFWEVCQSLAHLLYRCGGCVRLGHGPFQNPQGQGAVRLGELERDVVLGRGGAMFGGQGQLRALAAHIQIGVTPAMEFAGTAQGLSGAAALGVFAGVMNQHDRQLELALQFPQIREQPGDLGGVVLIEPMQADERVQDEQDGPELLDGLQETCAVGRGVQAKGRRGDDLDWQRV